MRARLLALTFLAATFGSHAASPDISVGTLFDHMEPDKSQLLKRVRNSGGATAYVRVEITEMHFDAAGNISETPVDAAALARNAKGVSGLIASPSRLIIPANNGQQATRLVYRGQRDAERYYRVRFVPVVPNTGEFSFDEQQASQYKEGLDAGVTVFTGFGAMVFVPPTDARYDTRIDAQAVSNQGNATIVLGNLRQCSVSKPEHCEEGRQIQVLPGKRHILAGDATHFTRFDLQEGASSRPVDTRH